jgi:hypothetical protein
VLRKPRRPRNDRRGHRARRPGRRSWSADIAAATTLRSPSRRDATPDAAPASRSAMVQPRRTKRPRALRRQKPQSSLVEGRNQIGARVRRRARAPIASSACLRDSVARTPRHESTSPIYSIPSACSWAFQSNRRSICGVSASTVSSNGWRPLAIAPMIRGARNHANLPSHVVSLALHPTVINQNQIPPILRARSSISSVMAKI